VPWITRVLVNTNPVIMRQLIRFNMGYDPARSMFEVYSLSDLTTPFLVPTFIAMDDQDLPSKLLCPRHING
jgi:hypothetical protein